MVWQLPSVSAADLAAAAAEAAAAAQTTADSAAGTQETAENKIKTVDDPEEISRTSSSLDLGPTPGSGIMTADSESEASEHTVEGNGAIDTVDKLPDSFEQPDEKRKDSASSVLEWNSQLTGAESIVSLQRDEEQRSADSRGLGPEAPSPIEDFTQQMQHSPTEEEKEG